MAQSKLKVKRKHISVGRLLDIASRGYDRYVPGHDPDLIQRASKSDDVGDGLARFIAVELSGTYAPGVDADANFEEAIRVMHTAALELQGVVDELEEAMENFK